MFLWMPKMKKRKKNKDCSVELIDTLADLMTTLKTQKMPKGLTKDMVETLADILKENDTFLKMLADPKSDLSVFEPIIKNMVKKNGRRKS